jgi:hypothetical protein
MIVALEKAVRDRVAGWTPERELQALTAELTHAHLLTTLRANGAKNVGKPLHIPRPWDKKASAKPISMGEFIRQTQGGSHV